MTRTDDIARAITSLETSVGNPDKSLKERVYTAMREAILFGRLEEGKRLQERHLAEQIGISRTPVREALQRLHTEGFLAGTSEGLVVKSFAIQEIIDIYEFRIALEGISARLAAERATYGDMAELKKLHRRMVQAVANEDIVGLIKANRASHLAMARISGSRFLTWFVGLLHDAVQRSSSTTFADSDRREEALQEHEELLEAIGNGDSEAAEAIMRRHMLGAQRTRIELLERGEWPRKTPSLLEKRSDQPEGKAELVDVE